MFCKRCSCDKNDKLTNIVVILDRSGSMESVAQQTIDGFNEFVNKQKSAGGNATLTLVQFDDMYEIVYKNAPINEVSKLTPFTYVPRGLTALLDAVGKTITTVRLQYTGLCEKCKPDGTIFVVITDGIENNSREYSRDQVFSMIRRQEQECGWEFVFLGANQDAIQNGMNFGFKSGSSATYNSTTTGTSKCFNKMSDQILKYRSMNSVEREELTSGSIELFSSDDRSELLEE